MTIMTMPASLAATPDVVKLIDRLGTELAASKGALERNDAYLRGEHPLAFMQPIIKEKLDDRILPMVANFTEFVTETYESRLDIEGFEFPKAEGQPSPEELWTAWQASDMDEQSSMAHYEALGLGRSYYVVGAGESHDDAPTITVESALQMIDLRSPRTREVTSAAKFWTEDEGREQWCGIWTGEFDATYRRSRGGWVEDWRDDHERGAVSVVPVVCKPRILDRRGRSIFQSLLPISDGLNKTLSDMMTSMEFHAIPRRWATGLSENDFKDEYGNDVSVFKLMADQVWAVASKEAKFGQFAEADLKNFHDSAKLLVKMIGMLCALPAHTVAFETVNPPSADSMRSAESDFVKREERLQRGFGGDAEVLMRHVAQRISGRRDPALRLMEAKWRDPATPTIAQKADAVVKKFQAGIIPVQQARIDLGYSPEERRKMDEMDREAGEAYFEVARKPLSMEVSDAAAGAG